MKPKLLDQNQTSGGRFRLVMGCAVGVVPRQKIWTLRLCFNSPSQKQPQAVEPLETSEGQNLGKAVELTVWLDDFFLSSFFDLNFTTGTGTSSCEVWTNSVNQGLYIFKDFFWTMKSVVHVGGKHLRNPWDIYLYIYIYASPPEGPPFEIKSCFIGKFA